MRSVRFRKLLIYEWDVVAAAIAAIGAIFFSHVGLVSEDVVRAVILLLLAITLLRGMRTEAHVHLNAETLDLIRRHIYDIEDKVGGTDVVLITPLQIRQEFREFAARIHGEVIWYNACCRMFRRQDVFNATLRLLVDNPDVTSIQLICLTREQPAWQADVVAKVRKCDSAGKVRDPLWGATQQATSFILAELRTEGVPQALVVVMEEPFASLSQGASVPRYLLRVQNHSPLLPRMDELARAAMGNFGTVDTPELHRTERGEPDAAAADPA